MILILHTKNESILNNRYWDNFIMVPDGLKVWTDGMEGQTHRWRKKTQLNPSDDNKTDIMSPTSLGTIPLPFEVYFCAPHISSRMLQINSLLPCMQFTVAAYAQNSGQTVSVDFLKKRKFIYLDISYI